MTVRHSTALALIALLALAGLPACAQQGAGNPRVAARAAWLRGDLDRAIGLYRALAEGSEPTTADRRDLVRALSDAGRYTEALAAARSAGGGETQNVLGEVLRLVGQSGAAESAFSRAIATRASDQLVAQVNLGLLAIDRGDGEHGRSLLAAALDAARRRSGRLSPDELVALGSAYQALGADDPQLFREALRTYDLAIAADSANQDARIRLGELFLEKYNAPDAAATFQEVIAANPTHARAHLGLARHAYFDGTVKVGPHLEAALKANERLVPALVLRARLFLDNEDYPGAEREAQRALAINGEDASALAVVAASRWLRRDQAGFREIRSRALALNPHDAAFFADLAEAAGRNRLYRDAAAFAREGVALDATAWRTVGVLGINDLRIGEMQEGRRLLERAFAGDPYNVWYKNTLDLLDQLDKYQEVRSPRIVVYADSSEAALLAPYAIALAEEAYDSLAARYRFRPPLPIRLELYRSHADFSVRTVGLAGLGALGASFGTVLAMDAPSARTRGEFNWGSTLWHELAHTFTLGVTDHRVPRWVSEGLSVLEERRARPGWGAHPTLGFLAALKGDRLHPVSKLNDGFVRPTYPEQVAHSYYQASLVCEYIEQRWGPEAINRFLAAFKDGHTAGEATRSALGVDSGGLDREFNRWVKDRFARELTAVSSSAVEGEDPAAAPLGRPVPTAGVNPGDFVGLLRAGRILYDQGKVAESVPLFERAKALMPDYAEPDSPYWYLARIARDQGDTKRAIAELQALVTRQESAYEPNLMLADLHAQAGDTAAMAMALERTLWIQPGDRVIHTRLAQAYARLGRHALAVRERRAILATHPVDRADAEYQLALALRAAGDLTGARQAVVRALEIAPAFEAAQTLLLDLRRRAPN